MRYELDVKVLKLEGSAKEDRMHASCKEEKFTSTDGTAACGYEKG